ncbi:homocysteine S-methyltransferase family protein [Nakamurella sp. GG22]
MIVGMNPNRTISAEQADATTSRTTTSRTPLPQLEADAFLTDAGLETSLIYDEGLELPNFAAFGLLQTRQGRAALLAYYERYVRIAVDHRLGVVLETATWRASRDWLAGQGFVPGDVARLNRLAVQLLLELREKTVVTGSSVVISGCIGPRFDGYAPRQRLTATESHDYHAEQVAALTGAGVDLVSALTMTSADEAIGIARAAGDLGVPVVISFTVETDGRLPDGTPLDDAIQTVDAATDAYPAYFMVNCAHPEHVAATLSGHGAGIRRIRGIRPNASRLSHAELDEAEELDSGDPAELAAHCVALRGVNPRLTIMGGCCGTNHEHIAALAEAVRR